MRGQRGGRWPMLGLGSPLHQQHQSPKPQKPRYKGPAAECRAVTSHNSSTRDGLQVTTEGRPLGKEVFREGDLGLNPEEHVDLDEKRRGCGGDIRGSGRHRHLRAADPLVPAPRFSRRQVPGGGRAPRTATRQAPVIPACHTGPGGPISLPFLVTGTQAHGDTEACWGGLECLSRSWGQPGGCGVGSQMWVPRPVGSLPARAPASPLGACRV